MAEEKEYSLDEVGKHTSAKDAWITIHNKGKKRGILYESTYSYNI